MAMKKLWSRICEALSGSKRKEKAEAKAKAEARAKAEAEAEAEAEARAKRQEAINLVKAIHKFDVKTVHAMLEAGCNVNYVFTSVVTRTVDMDVYDDTECYTPIECADEPMKTLLKAYGGMTYDEYRAAEEKKKLAKWKAECDAKMAEMKRQKRLKQKQARQEVEAILAEKNRK